MATTIQDGTGEGWSLKIDSEGRLYNQSVNDTAIEYAAQEGRAFNINTQFLPISSSGENALLYVKNNEEEDLVVAAWFIGTDFASGSATRSGLAAVYVNPTGGTLIASASVVTPVNRRLGSAETLDALIYKGGDGYTITGQLTDPVLYQTQGASARAFGNVYITVPKGSSLAVTYTPNGAEPLEIYTGFQVYKQDAQKRES
jgi:hypothetical protein